MDVIIFAVLIILNLNNYGQTASTCEIVGIKEENDWTSTYVFKVPINDTFRGEIAAYQTRNIQRVRVSEQKYINVTWENQVLRFLTADDFEEYERNTAYTSDPYISVKLSFDCIQDNSKSLTFKQPVLDVNTHDPVLNQRSYDYSFGMTIPKNFKFTDLIPIFATDYDITDDRVFFTIEENENFKLTTEVRQSSKKFATEFIALNEIQAPYSQKFTLVATDYGIPPRTNKASLKINVYNPDDSDEQSNEEEDVNGHPPIFAKHLYFADYNSNNELKLEEPIVVIYGAESKTVLKQTGYENFFTAEFQDDAHTTITLTKRSQPSFDILQTDFITIELEVSNEDFKHMPGRTALLIRMPGSKNGNSEEDSDSCKDTVIFGYSVNGYVVPMVLFLLTVFSIVFINIYVIIMFVNKQKVRVYA